MLWVSLLCGVLLFSTAAAAHGQSAGLLFEDVTLIDGTGRAPIEHAYVWIEGDRIVRERRALDGLRAEGRLGLLTRGELSR